MGECNDEFMNECIFVLGNYKKVSFGILVLMLTALKAKSMYRVILKKVSSDIFRIIFLKKKKSYHRKQRQSTISEQVFIIFAHCQNHQN